MKKEDTIKFPPGDLPSAGGEKEKGPNSVSTEAQQSVEEPSQPSLLPEVKVSHLT